MFKYEEEDLAKLIRFITGSSKIPIEGFRGLRAMDGVKKINIVKAKRKDLLPVAHACFNQLELPEYDSK